MLSSIGPIFKGGQIDDKSHSWMPKSSTYSPTVETDVESDAHKITFSLENLEKPKINSHNIKNSYIESNFLQMWTWAIVDFASGPSNDFFQAHWRIKHLPKCSICIKILTMHPISLVANILIKSHEQPWIFFKSRLHCSIVCTLHKNCNLHKSTRNYQNAMGCKIDCKTIISQSETNPMCRYLS